jgi:hypothetical protein
LLLLGSEHLLEKRGEVELWSSSLLLGRNSTATLINPTTKQPTYASGTTARSRIPVTCWRLVAALTVSA